MKNSLLFGLGLLFSTAINAQSFTLLPGDSVNANAPCNDLSIFKVDIENLKSTKLSVSWSLLSNTLVGCWDKAICQYGTCFAGIPNGGTMDSIAVGGNGFFDLNINPITYSGNGEVKLLVYETGNPAMADTLTYYVTGCSTGSACVTGITDNSQNSDVNIYPNPATDLINIKLINTPKSIEVLNILGEVVMKNNPSSNATTISTASLSSGLYFIRIYNNDNSIGIKKIYKQ